MTPKTNSTARSIFVLIAAAGCGSRLGGATPKQYLDLGGKNILRRSIEAFLPFTAPEHIRVIIDANTVHEYQKSVSGLTVAPYIIGGQTRKQSVYNGLMVLPDLQDQDIILIHDAARPFVKPEDIKAMLEVLQSGEAAAASLYAPLHDTIREKDTLTTLNRDALMAVQTPQGFCAETIFKAHQHFKDADNGAFTDDAAMVAALGIPVAYIAGSRQNFKITTQDDYIMAQNLQSLQNLKNPKIPQIRSGIGFDVHAFADTPNPAKTLRLGGIDISHDRALSGHSDADVALHAITDALLGAMGLGDIGDHFPPSDQTYKGMDSAIFLEKMAELVAEKGGRINNIDLTIICEAPKLTAYKAQIQSRIASILTLEAAQIGVKATTTERLGFTGRGEGIAAQAIATVEIISAQNNDKK
jgi:2-C-methyl-D-erythritol 4-phosphate cytidylyltransferase/2-C-methyl-D-erythritol 2,4-cyclodiphosphate synthase